jgi:hypothetical protein
MKAFNGARAAAIGIALCAVLVFAGCQADDGSKPGQKTSVKYYEMTNSGYTVTDKSGSVVADGVTHSAYIMQKPDATVATGTHLGIKDNKLFVLDVNPALSNGASFKVGLPNGRVAGLATIAQMADYIEGYNTTVLGGINADFFDVVEAVGGTLGNTMKSGRWITTGEYNVEGKWDYNSDTKVGVAPNATTGTFNCHPGYSFGVKADGTAVIDFPDVKMFLSITRTSSGTTTTIIDNKRIDILNGNRADKATTSTTPAGAYAARTDNALVLYTTDYSNDTGTLSGGVEIRFTTSGSVKSNSAVTGTVARSGISETGSMSIYAGTMVLSACSIGGDTTLVDALKTVQASDAVTITVSVGDAWKDVVECVGGGRHDGGPLLVKDGAVRPNDPNVDAAATFTSWYGNNPRTSVGVRADGSYFFYVVDGRQTDASLGATIQELGQIAVDLGAVSAVNFDGGGSSTMIVGTGDISTYSVKNKPAYGFLRSDGNAAFIVAK